MPLIHSRKTVSMAVHGLSPCISPLTCFPACAPFTPSNSGQRLPPTYYRGCWHVVSRGFLLGYRHYLHQGQRFTIRKPSSLTRRCCIRLSPIVQYSPLLPPVGVWAVSQSQCGRSTSRHAAKILHAVLAFVSKRYPPLKGRLLTRYSPVRH